MDTSTDKPPAGAGFNLTLPLSLGGVTAGGPGNGCMRQPEASMQPVTGPDDDDSSAYLTPAAPPQSPEAWEPNTAPVARRPSPRSAENLERRADIGAWPVLADVESR